MPATRSSPRRSATTTTTSAAASASSAKNNDDGSPSNAGPQKRPVRRTAVGPKNQTATQEEGRGAGDAGPTDRVESGKNNEGGGGASDASPAGSEASAEAVQEASKAKNGGKKRTPRKRKEDVAVVADGDASSKSSPDVMPPKPTPKRRRTSSSDHQRHTNRDALPKLWDADRARKEKGSYTFKIMSWNVAGLRALMRNHPTALPDLASKHNFDLICLQETKLQESHVDDPKLKINGHLLNDEGYDAHYNCATAKKGYSGTAVFVKRRSTDSEKGGKVGSKKQATLGSFFGKKKNTGGTSGRDKAGVHDDIGDIDVKNLIPEQVSCKMGKAEHDAEGRIIVLDFPLFTMANLYVPNSGQKLDRLGYRTQNWDADLLSYMKQKEEERGVPVLWLGDLNVAHKAMDTWNEGAKHLAKSAGTTPEERASFESQLGHGYVDAFRVLHPEAWGQYTYWSQRAGNREPNKGLRLDYFICSQSMMAKGNEDEEEEGKVILRDSYMLMEQLGSDHCPVVLELEIKK